MTKPSEHGHDWLMIDAVVGSAFDEDEREHDVDAAATDVASRDADPATVAQLRSALSMAFDRIWRDRLAMAADARHATRAVPLAAARPRVELLARLAALATRYPRLVAQHRSLAGDSDETLRAMIEDIEAVTGDREE